MTHDTIIIGGGPAGLSAAIYLARFNRRVLVIDRGRGRSTFDELNENYLGFPQGIQARKLRILGQKQAQRFGSEFIKDYVAKVEMVKNIFLVHTKIVTYQSKTIILATGVTDLFPLFTNYQQYVGHSLFWCITCDGYKMANKKLLIVGQDDDAVCTALQFLIFTRDITFLTNCYPGVHSISPDWLRKLKDHSIPFFEGIIKSVHGENGFIKKVILEDGKKIVTQYMVSQRGASPNIDLAKMLEVEVDHHGYIKTDLEQRTNIPYVYAAGDVTKIFSHQIATAVHEGSMAAQAANYDLYEPYQRL